MSKNTICSYTSYLNKQSTSWQEEQEAGGRTGCPPSRQPHSDDWARVRSSLQSCQLHLWHNYVKVAQKLQVSWFHSGRQTSSCSRIDHAAQAGHRNTLAGIFVVSDHSCPCPSRGPVQKPSIENDCGDSLLAFQKCPCLYYVFVLSPFGSALYSAEDL